MTIRKAKSANPAPKKIKTASEIGKELRELIADFLITNFKKITEDVKKLLPRERVKVFCDLLQFVVPKLKSIEDHGPFEHMTDQQLDHIIDELKKAG